MQSGQSADGERYYAPRSQHTSGAIPRCPGGTDLRWQTSPGHPSAIAGSSRRADVTHQLSGKSENSYALMNSEPSPLVQATGSRDYRFRVRDWQARGLFVAVACPDLGCSPV